MSNAGGHRPAPALAAHPPATRRCQAGPGRPEDQDRREGLPGRLGQGLRCGRRILRRGRLLPCFRDQRFKVTRESPPAGRRSTPGSRPTGPYKESHRLYQARIRRRTEYHDRASPGTRCRRLRTAPGGPGSPSGPGAPSGPAGPTAKPPERPSGPPDPGAPAAAGGSRDRPRSSRLLRVHRRGFRPGRAHARTRALGGASRGQTWPGTRPLQPLLGAVLAPQANDGAPPPFTPGGMLSYCAPSKLEPYACCPGARPQRTPRAEASSRDGCRPHRLEAALPSL